jgi:hypothetical protein
VYLGDGGLPWGPVLVEDLGVRRQRNRPGGPSCGDGGARLIPQLGTDVSAELRRSSRSVEDGLLLIIGVHGGGICRDLLRVIREPRDLLCDLFIGNEVVLTSKFSFPSNPIRF